MRETSGPDYATEEWRRKVCSRCSSCGSLLAFMEGPLCDPCLDLNEVCPAGQTSTSLRS